MHNQLKELQLLVQNAILNSEQSHELLNQQLIEPGRNFNL